MCLWCVCGVFVVCGVCREYVWVCGLCGFCGCVRVMSGIVCGV